MRSKARSVLSRRRTHGKKSCRIRPETTVTYCIGLDVRKSANEKGKNPRRERQGASMTWAAFCVSILSVALVFFFRSKNETVIRALNASQERESELEQTLVEILDGDGNICGQLMLPGKTSTNKAMIALQKAEVSLEAITAQTDDLRRNIEQERENNENIKVLVEAVNGDSIVKIRLPGKTVTPNRTPCGMLCKHTFHIKDLSHCNIGYTKNGNRCSESRKEFLDVNNQCVMFERREAE